MAKLSIILITYNAARFLPACLESLQKQTFRDFELVAIDNGSTDETVSLLEQQGDLVAKVVKNTKNLGYAGGGNQGIRMTAAPYVMILTQDIVFEPDYLEKVMAALERDKKIGSIAGKLLRYDFAANAKTKEIDSTGLLCFRNRRVVDRDQGMEDIGQRNQSEAVFGVTGACPIYRREALEDVKVPSLQDRRGHGPSAQTGGGLGLVGPNPTTVEPLQWEFFDEDFFMYKEDIDLAWRLQLFGWTAWYEASAVAYHGRSTGILKRYTHWEVLHSRKALSKFHKFYSYKNQRLMMVKNELPEGLKRDALPILWKEFLIFGYMCFREPHLFRSLSAFARQYGKARKKRAYIMERKRVGWPELKRWFEHTAPLD